MSGLGGRGFEGPTNEVSFQAGFRATAGEFSQSAQVLTSSSLTTELWSFFLDHQCYHRNTQSLPLWTCEHEIKL